MKFPSYAFVRRFLSSDARIYRLQAGREVKINLNALNANNLFSSVQSHVRMCGGELLLKDPTGKAVMRTSPSLAIAGIRKRILVPVIELYTPHPDEFYRAQGYPWPPIVRHDGQQYAVAVHVRPVQGKEVEVARHFAKDRRQITE